jgi:hypothetical protein
MHVVRGITHALGVQTPSLIRPFSPEASSRDREGKGHRTAADPPPAWWEEPDPASDFGIGIDPAYGGDDATGIVVTRRQFIHG